MKEFRECAEGRGEEGRVGWMGEGIKGEGKGRRREREEGKGGERTGMVSYDTLAGLFITSVCIHLLFMAVPKASKYSGIKTNSPGSGLL